MKSVNKAIIIGRLGRDPEGRFTPSGKPVTTFTVACNREWKNAEGGKESHTEWINIEAWGRAAEILNQYMRKGNMIYLEGRIQTDRYRPEGASEDKFFTKVVVQEFMFLGGNRAGERVEAEEPEGAEIPVEEDLPF